MAVTVTKAAPATALSSVAGFTRTLSGSYGVTGSAITADPGDQFIQNKRVKVVKWTLSGTYITGGFALAASDYGLAEIHHLLVIANSTSSTVPVSAGTIPALDVSSSFSAPTVRLYTDTATELTNATSVTNFVFNLVIIGV